MRLSGRKHQNPAIIVGHLQHSEIIPYSYFRNVLEGYKNLLLN